ncbi:MAX gene-associated protein isoform X1 [Scophthalmus maximus]|nr:MAX gene-associated protein isoform X1 [Scophthalmus maximus]XP_035472965.2 MAX gene-associated protein isoform X1 [Scophthalmus maximus]XP_035472967.2 MAX gene-associated protein isoform X1 [Scophthalmus maximus]XP_035472968.2 MAX gene-associated protein isoform X1 [Scophthalmus maximus]XP_035472969.2 MAX gene-associated protein isoform X1 [Scophthalmus maximus]XP_035472970.2 MAX gene-associated protein isoform X1 [Scophthalmus maximus]
MEELLPLDKPAPDSELAPMEDPHVVEDEKGSPTDAPPPTVPVSTPHFPPTMANFTDETVIENRAISMASNDCSSALSSPAEASPAKPAASSPHNCEGAVETSPATSYIASASDSLNCTGTSLVSIAEPPPLLSEVPSTTFGSLHLESDYSNTLTFKGVTVTLENNKVWRQFHGCGTEMILTKPGRRMFPYCRFRLAGLDPECQYSLVLSIVPSDQYKYRWNRSQWEISGPAENQAQGLIRAFAHHFSTCKGSDWMGSLVSFYKLKLTNNSQDQDNHIILHSMHRYIPRLHVIPVPEDVVTTPDQPVVMGPESMTFTFPQTEFMAVTTYQNFRITQLKINYNPFAKGFRENGNNPRLNRVATDAQTVVRLDTRADVSEQSESKEAAVDLSTKNHCVTTPIPNVQETRLVLKPIMSAPSNKDVPYVPCIRGKHALGELVLVEENLNVGVNSKLRPGPKVAPAPSTSTLGSSPRTRKRRKKMSRRWANYRQREWKSAAAAAPPPVVHSPSLTAALQPELDDVEGLLFVSFTSKDALEVHIRNMPANGTASASPVSLTTPNKLKQTVEVIPETDGEKIARMESVLLQDLRVVKHRQVIHPVLREVGLKLSSLDPTKSIDLQYLGVHLPLPPAPANLPEHVNSKALGDNGLPFISRTGKTCDMTKIKGWRNKFIKRKEPAPNCDGLQKNLSAFCSDMLDEYLESEAQQISERAAAFSASPEGSVAYQLPAKGSSYVKTLDSVLKHRTAASNRPCPLSHKPHLYSALTSQAPPLPRPATPVQAEAPSTPRSSSSHTQPGASPTGDAKDAAGSTHTSAVSQRPTVSPGQNQAMAHRPPGLTKFELKLWQMELGPLNQGLSRTQLTADRLSVALSVMLTKQMLYSHGFKVPSHPKYDDGRPECAQEFCRLGCVCSSLQHVNRGPLHCRRPGCMFGCDCFKRKITMQLSAGESEQQIQPLYSMTNKEHAVQPRPSTHTNKLWNRNTHDVDPEPLFAPKTPQYSAKTLKRSSATRPVQPINEEDKDPVYKYLESMMTCARVREFNSKLRPEVVEQKILDVSAANATTKLPKRTADNPPRHCPRSKKTLKTAAEKTSQETTASEADAKKQIQIQSACQWDTDHKMVLEALCQRMNQNRLSRRFRVGPYLICPVAKIFMKKPSGSLVTYRVNISKPSTVSEEEEEEFDDSDEEKLSNKSFGEEDDGQAEGLEMRVGVTPFLSGVLPAGRLVARTKPVGCQAYGLIQVNGKAYNQARLLLGSIGSLHPANRLAAYVTGRLRAPADIFHKHSKKPDSSPKNNTPGTLHVKSANAAVPQMITARRTTDLEMATQPPVKLRLDSCRTGSIAFPQPQISSSFKAVQSFISSQLSSGRPFLSSSTSSPVSLTVSPALKTPNFLGQRGTYSFRICPPAGQSTRGQNPPGITLPGGFTLIELPKPGASSTTQRSETVNTTNVAGVDKSLPHKDALFNFGLDANWLGLDTLNAGKALSSTSLEPGSSSKMVHGEKMPLGQSDEANSKKVLDFLSEGLSSEDSDYCVEGDEDEEPLDVETVEEAEQEMAVANLKQAPVNGSQESQDQMFHELTSNNRRRENHTALERQRRSDQRHLFDKLQKVLQSDPKAPRLHHLALAQKEIRHLTETSKFLMDKKKMLTQIHADYVKKLSLLSGKPVMLIKSKLMDICQRQKIREKTMEFKPFFSKLLQSRAALLQDTTSQSNFQQMPLLQSNFFAALSQAKPHAAAAQKNVHQTTAVLQPKPQRAQSSVHTPKPLSAPRHHIKAASSPAAAKATAAPAQVENQVSHQQSKLEDQQEAPGAPAQGMGPKSQTRVPSGPASLQVTAAQDGDSPVFSTPKPQNPFTQPSQSFSIPLIRSKTGRLILPSSMKPTGKPGFFTLMLMKAKQKEGESAISSSANTQPPDEDSKNQDKSCSSSNHLSGSASSRILEQDKTTSSHSDPKRSPLTTPLTQLAILNKSIHVPAAAAPAADNKQDGATVPLAAARLSFNGVRQVPTSAEAVRNPIIVVCRRRGRPPKNRVGPPVSAVLEEIRRRKREASILVEEVQSGKKSVELSRTRAGHSPGMASDVADSPMPVKRGRGRPPKKKKKSAHPWGVVAREGKSLSNSNEDSPVRVSSRFKSPDKNTLTGDMNTSRPLTRGALGKDFPSAKKRSWIDLEKDLEPEIEFE